MLLNVGKEYPYWVNPDLVMAVSRGSTPESTVLYFCEGRQEYIDRPIDEVIAVLNRVVAPAPVTDEVRQLVAGLVPDWP